MSNKSVSLNSPAISLADPAARSNPAVESPEERQISIAKLRDMSRDERLDLLMRNFSAECADVGGRPRRGAAAPRKAPACTREAAQESASAQDIAPRVKPRRRPGV